MGEARRRGTFEERKAAAILRRRGEEHTLAEEQRKADHLADLEDNKRIRQLYSSVSTIGVIIAGSGLSGTYTKR